MFVFSVSKLHQRDTSFSHTWISVIFHVTFINGYTPVILGKLSLFPACCASSFPCACCLTACEQDTPVWSPCGSCTLGMGGWNGSCTLNKHSLKATRYLPLPLGWELMETQLWKCSGFPGSSSMEHREDSSDPSDQVMVSGFIPGYQNDHHPDPNTPFQSWFHPRETNFQL